MLREFLYVDTDKVRSLLAQMNGGVVEEFKETDKKEGKGGIGIKGFATREGVWSREEGTSKSAADAIFPTLEDELYAKGFMADVSDELAVLGEEGMGEFMKSYPPGSIVRITGEGRLFDARYVSQVLSGLTAVAQGIATLSPEALPNGSRNSGKTTGNQGKRSSPRSSNNTASIGPQLEDSIPDFPGLEGWTGISTTQLRALVQLARGMFTPGLHLHLDSSSEDRVTVTARLQEGRRFLDGDAEVLFARYGTEAQEWTIVGTIGNYARESHPEQNASFIDAKTSNISRSESLRSINDVMRDLGAMGMADVPRFPGFSIVPFAVYRPIGRILPFDGSAVMGIV